MNEISPVVGSLLGYLALTLLLALNGAFVAVEFAMVAADRPRIALAAEQGSRRAVGLEAMLRRLTFHLSGAQVGVTFSSILIGFLAEPLLARSLRGPLSHVFGASAAHGLAIAAALILVTVTQLIGAELVPKNVAVARPESTALTLAVALRIFDAAFAPLITATDRAANRLVRAVGVEPVEQLESVPTLEELASLVRSSGEAGSLGRRDAELLTRTIRFGDKTAADALVPRVDVVALPQTANVADLAAAVATHGYSRYPVYGDDLDDVVGVVLAKDVYAVPYRARAATPIEELVSPIVVVPESQPLEELLTQLRGGGRQLAAVIDEYGGTAGIITLEDVLEELVGEIDDEHDNPELTTVPTGSSYVLDASLHPDEVTAACGLVLPDGPYETLAGFALVRLDRVPAPGDRFEWSGWAFTINAMDGRRIDRITVQPPEAS